MRLTEIHYTDEDIVQKRGSVAQRFCQSSPSMQGGRMAELSTDDLELLLALYDEEFFHNRWKQEIGRELKFSLSTRMSKSAGKTVAKKRRVGGGPPVIVDLEIRIALNFFLRFHEIAGAKLVCGLEAPNALWALLLVMEHELCHVIELTYFQNSSCKQERFKQLAHRLFGHKASDHHLPTAQEVAYRNHGIRIGEEVTFTYRDEVLEGIVSRITKRATVMVPTLDGP